MQDATIQTPTEAPEQMRTPRFALGSWGFFWLFCLGSLLFWLAQIAYQYYILKAETPAAAVVRGSAFTGATMIAAALFVSALRKWSPRLLAAYWRLRRNLGVAGVIFTIFHVLGVIWLYNNWNIAIIFFSFNPLQNPIIFGVIAFIILLAMASASNDWAQKKLGGRRWKNLHRLIYLGFPAIIFHYTLTNPAALKNPAGYLLILMTTLAVFGQLFWFFKIAGSQKFKTKGATVGLVIIALVIITAVAVYLQKMSVAST